MDFLIINSYAGWHRTATDHVNITFSQHAGQVAAVQPLRQGSVHVFELTGNSSNTVVMQQYPANVYLNKSALPEKIVSSIFLCIHETALPGHRATQKFMYRLSVKHQP